MDPRPTGREPGPPLPPLPPASRELVEVLWSASRPLTIARRFPHRAGRKIETVSTLLAELMAQGWVAGEKRGGTHWLDRAAVSRGEGARPSRPVGGRGIRPRAGEDRRHLVLAALRMPEFVSVDSYEPEALGRGTD